MVQEATRAAARAAASRAAGPGSPGVAGRLAGARLKPKRLPKEPLRCCPGEGWVRYTNRLLPRYKGIYHVGYTDYPNPTYP